jgi:ethanolamine ammonia-lyase large subunit
MNLWRRLVRDYEQRVDCSQAMIHIAMGSLLIRLKRTLTLTAAAGNNFIIAVPGADDILLNYQSTSVHDQLYIRDLLKVRRSLKFSKWLQNMEIADQNGKL